MYHRKPSMGLGILESLRLKHPNLKYIENSLINAYIRCGDHEKALQMIANIPETKTDVSTLKLKAWAKHYIGDIEQEKELWSRIIDKTYYLEVEKKDNDLILLQKAQTDNTQQDIILFSKVYNEMLRLPYFLKYYRNLGVKNFFIIDNDSTDGSCEFLLEQKDCNVYWTNNSHNEAAGGTAWINQLIQEHAYLGQWCMYVDVDEFLVYPNCETKNLQKLATDLDNHDEEGMVSYMLDIFPRNLKTLSSIKNSDDLISRSPYFYNNYVFYERPECPYQYPAGGLYSLHNYLSPLTKTALFKYHKGFLFLQSSHASTPFKVSKITSAYLHCKFIGDFSNKTREELKRKEYFGGAKAYKRYQDIFDDYYENQNFDFSDFDKAVKFENSHQLLNLRLIKDRETIITKKIVRAL